jgi:cystathionine beta-lyase/cystathionine gamma-synthase
MMVSKSAWPIMVYGLPTLDLRMRKQEKTAGELARFLEEHAAIGKVHYPGLESFPYRELARRQMRNFDDGFAPGNMIYFVLAGSVEESFRRGKALVNYIGENAYAMTLAVSLGNIRTLIEMPASMTHALVPDDAKAGGGIDIGGIRVSVGIEDTIDILRDLEAAIEVAMKA